MTTMEQTIERALQKRFSSFAPYPPEMIPTAEDL